MSKYVTKRKLIVAFLTIGMVINLLIWPSPPPAKAQVSLIIPTIPAQAVIAAEVAAYKLAHSFEETATWASTKMELWTLQATTRSIVFKQAAAAFGIGNPCYNSRSEACLQQILAKFMEIRIQSTIAGGVCLVAAVAAGPAGTAVFVACMTIVILVHYQRIEAAEHAYRVCLTQARDVCYPPTPSPTPCPLSREDMKLEGDIEPLLYNCQTEEEYLCEICPPRTPILIDMEGDGFDMTSLADGVRFNLTGAGLESLGWTRAGSDDAWLVLDRNLNGVIDDGSEMFGNYTPQPAPVEGAERNGFAALAQYDYNRDGVINEADPPYHALHLWTDSNHDGVSEASELQPMYRSLKSISLDYSRHGEIDKFGNDFRYRAEIEDYKEGQHLGKFAWDVFLVSGRPPRSQIGGKK